MGSCRGAGALTICVPAPMRFKKRPSAFNACVGAELKGKTYAKPKPGMGGKRDARIQSAFTTAAKKCKTK